MFKLHVVQASDGDCFFLQYGASKSKFIMIDSGPTFSAELREKLAQVRTKGEVATAIISHIDSDHIVGLQDILQESTPEHMLIEIKDIWHNSFSSETGRSTRDVLIAIRKAEIDPSAKEGVKRDLMRAVTHAASVEESAKRLGIEINGMFGEARISNKITPNPVKMDNISVQFIGPSQENLDKLKEAWKEAEKKERARSHSKPAIDNSPWNMSSIMFLARSSSGKSILFTGDGISKDIVEGLQSAGLLENDKIHVDILKVPHHGSDRNNDIKLFSTVIADTYVVSANKKHCNPDRTVLEMIVRQAKKDGRHFKLVVTNNTDRVQEFTNAFKPAEHDYDLVFIPKGEHSLELLLESNSA